MKSLWTPLVGALLLAVPLAGSRAQAITSAGSGAWDAPATWAGGIVPTSTNAVTVSAGHTVTINAAVTATAASLVATGAVPNNGTLTVTGNITGVGSITQGTNAVLNAGGTLTVTTLTATANPNTVNYTGAAQTLKSTTYRHVGLSGSGAKTLVAGISIAGDLTLSGTATATTVAALTIGGNLTVNPGTTFTAAAFALTVTGTTTLAGGNLTSSGAAGASVKTFTGDVTVQSGSTFLISATTGTNLFSGDVTVATGGTWTHSAAAPVTWAGNLVKAGTLTATSGVVTMSGAGKSIGGTVAISSLAIVGTVTNTGTLTVATALSGAGTLTNDANATLNLGGTSLITALDASANPNTVNYTGAAQTVKATTYWHLGLSGSAAKTLTGVSTVNGNLTLSGTATAATAANFTIGGNLTVNTGSTFTPAGFSLDVTGATSVTGSLTISSATGAKTFGGDVTINAGGTWTNTAANAPVTLGGNLAKTGTLNAGTGIYTFTGPSATITGTVVLGSATITGSVANAGTLTVSTALAGAGALTNDVSATLNLGGTATIATLAATASPNTVNYTGAAQTVLATSYHHLGLSGSGAKTLTGVSTVNGNLTTSGTITAATATALAVGGAATVGTGTTVTVTAATTLDAASLAAAGAVVNNGTLAVAGAISGAGSVTQGANALLDAGAAVSVTTLTATAAPNTVNYTGAAQTVKATTYHHLGLSGSGAKTLVAATTVNGDWTMSGTATATTVAALTIGGNLTVNTGTTFTAAAFALTVTGTTTLAGGNLTSSGAAGAAVKTFTGATTVQNGSTLLISATTGTNLFSGDVTVNAGGTWTHTAAAPVTIGGSLVNNGAFTASSGVVTMSGAAKTITGTVTLSSLAVTGTISNSAGNALTVSTALSGAGALTNAANATLTLTGTATVTTLTATASPNTVVYNGAAQTIKAAAYHHLVLAGSGVKTLTGLATVNGDLTLSGTAAATTAANLAVGGNVTLNAGTSFTVPAFALTVAGTTTLAGGSLTSSGAAGANTKTFTGAVVVQSGSTLVVSATTGTNQFADNVTVDAGGTWNQTGAAPVAIGGNVATAGTFTVGAAPITVAGTTTVAAGTLTSAGAAGALTKTFSGVVTVQSGATVLISATTGTNQFNAAVTVDNGGTWTVSGAAPVVFGGDFTNAGTFNGGSGAFTFNGNYVNTGSAPSGSFAIAFGGGSAQTIAPFTTTGTVSMLKTGGAATFGGNVSGGALTINGAAGTLDLGAGFTHTFTGTWTRTAGAVVANSSILNLGGTVVNTGGTFSAGTGTVNYTGAAQTLAAVTYNHLHLSGSGAKTQVAGTAIAGDLTLSGTATTTTVAALTIGGNLTVNPGTTFTAAAFALTVTGTTTLAGGNLTSSGAAGASVKTFTGDVTVQSGSTFLISATTGTNLFAGDVIVDAGGTWTHSAGAPVTWAGNLVKAGTLTATSGVVTMSGAAKSITGTVAISSLAITGTITNTGTLTVATALSGAGTLTNDANATLSLGGTSLITALDASANPNTVNYTGAAQTVKATAYWHLGLSGSAAKTLTGVSTVNGNLTLSGTATAATAANFTIGGTLTVNTGSTFTAGAFALSVAGTTTLSGGNLTSAGAAGANVKTFTGDVTVDNGSTLLITATTGTNLFSGDVTVNAGGAWTHSAAAPVTLDGSLFVAGTFTATSGVVTLSGTSKTITGTVTIASLAVTGTVTNTNTLTVGTALSGAGTLTNGAGATLDVAGTASVATLDASTSGNTVRYSGAAQTVKPGGYDALVLEGTGAKTLTGTTIGGVLSLEGTATGAGSAPAYAAGATLRYRGAGAQTTGVELPATFAGSGGIVIDNASGVTLGTSLTLTSPLTLTSGIFNVAANTLALDGPAIAGTATNLATTSASSLSFGGTAPAVTLPSSVTALDNLTIDNPAGLTLSGSPVVSGVLALSNGRIVTGGNTLIVAASGSVTGGSTASYVAGALRKTVATGVTSRTFEVGDGTIYAPVAIDFANVSIAGTLTARADALDHAAIATAGIAPARSVNRHWTLSNGGVAFDQYAATFAFAPSDLDGGTPAGTVIVARYDGASWTKPAVSARTATTTRATGMTAFGEYQLGEWAGTQLAVQTQPAGGASGAALAVVPVVHVRDASGATVTTDNGTVVTATIAAGTGGTLGGTTARTVVNGVATFTGLTLAGTAGTSYVLRFGVGTDSLAAAMSAATQVTAGAPAQYLVTASDAAPSAGAPVAITAQIADANGNAIATPGLTITWSKTGAGGSFSSPTSATGAGGSATVVFTTGGTAGTVYTVTATDNSARAGTSANITAVTGGATQLVADAGNAQTATVGTAVSVAPRVAVRDVNGNPVAGATVTFAVTAGGGSATGVSVVTGVDGLATVGGWTLGTTAGANALSATSAALAGSPVTFTATGIAGPATVGATTITAAPTAILADGIATSVVTVTLNDQYGNPTPLVAGLVTLETSAGTLLGSLADQGGGIHKQSLQSTAVSGTTATLSARIGGVPVAATAAVGFISGAISADAAGTRLAGNDLSRHADGVQAATITVQLRDAVGHALPVAGIAVGFSTTLGTLSATTATTDGSGVATVTLTSTDAGVASVTADVDADADPVTPRVAIVNGAPVTVTFILAPAAPANTTPPSIAGTLVVGQVLTLAAGVWTGTPAPALTVQWSRCDASGGACVDLAGATAANLVLVAADAGHTLRAAVTATNASGTATSSAVTGVVAMLIVPPDAPTGVAGVADSARAAISWVAPAQNGGASITDYAIQVSVDGGVVWIPVADTASAETFATLRGLTNHMRYVVRVAAVNAAGTGAFSAPSAPMIPSPALTSGGAEPPVQEPGTAALVLDGVAQAPIVSVIGGYQLRAANASFSVMLTAYQADGDSVAIRAGDISLHLRQGMGVRVVGAGYAPRSVVTVRLFSPSRLLGTIDVGSDGRFNGLLVVPADISLGEHTVQVSGGGPAATDVVFRFGAVVEDPLPLDLAIASSASKTKPAIGDTVVYTVNVTNRGEGRGFGVTVSAPLNARMKFVSAQPSAGSYDAATGTWTIDAIDRKSTVTLVITAVLQR